VDVEQPHRLAACRTSARAARRQEAALPVADPNVAPHASGATAQDAPPEASPLELRQRAENVQLQREAPPMYQVCLFVGWTAMWLMRPDIKAGPIERRRRSENELDD
jgi:hypothetical protein